MDKLNIIKTLLAAGLLTASSMTLAHHLHGSFCIPAGWGNLVMEFKPNKPDSHEGMMSVYNDKGSCMGTWRPYKLEGDNIVSPDLSANFDHDRTIFINAPMNWYGPWSKDQCVSQQQNPC
jgi:hypothetical protein